LIVALLALSCASCAGTAARPALHLRPELTRPCRTPALHGDTWRAIAALAAARGAALADCNRRLKALRDRYTGGAP